MFTGEELKDKLISSLSQVQPQARLGRRSRLQCSAVAAVEAPPTQVNIAKDVSELIG